MIKSGWVLLKMYIRSSFFESANDNTYELEIYDDTGVYHDPKEFMECITKGFRAVNLTEDDVQAFFDKVCDSV